MLLCLLHLCICWLSVNFMVWLSCVDVPLISNHLLTKWLKYDLKQVFITMSSTLTNGPVILLYRSSNFSLHHLVWHHTQLQRSQYQGWLLTMGRALHTICIFSRDSSVYTWGELVLTLVSVWTQQFLSRSCNYSLTILACMWFSLHVLQGRIVWFLFIIQTWIYLFVKFPMPAILIASD